MPRQSLVVSNPQDVIADIRRVYMSTSNLLLTGEVAQRLGVSSRRVRSLIESNRLPAHRASPSELAMLITAGRVTAIPTHGLWLIHEADLASVADRRVGRPPKAATDTTQK